MSSTRNVVCVFCSSIIDAACPRSPSFLYSSSIFLTGIPDDFEIAASEIMYFDVEYRLFVHDKKGNGERSVIDCRYYRGNFRKSLDWSVVDACVEAWTDAPCAYSLDMGLNNSGQTCVVEVNDCMSLGTYGIPAIPYTRMDVDRWEEAVGIAND